MVERDPGAISSTESISSPSGHGRWADAPADLIGAGVGDDQVLRGREHGVEQELSVFAARIALAGERTARQDVVAVGRAGPGEDAVVEAEQADHPVRHRAHRHHGAHRERSGAEVGPRRSARPVEPPSGSGRRRAAARGRHRLVRLRSRRAPARPGAAATRRPSPRRRATRPPSGAWRPTWPTGWVPVRRSLTSRRRSTSSARRPARSMSEEPTASYGSVTSKYRCASAETAAPARTRSSPYCQVFWRTAPSPKGARWSPSKAQRTPVSPTQRVMVSMSSSERPNRRRTGSVAARSSTAAGRGPTVGEVEQPLEDAEDRVGLHQRAIGEADLQLLVRVPAVGGAGDTTESERCLDQRGEALDVRTHDDDVARLERGVVGEQAEHDLAQHLDLPRGPVARVHLQRTIRRIDVEITAGARSASISVCSRPSKVSGRGPGRSMATEVVAAWSHGALELADVASQRGEQRVSPPQVGVVGGPAARSPAHSVTAGPATARRRRAAARHRPGGAGRVP